MARVFLKQEETLQESLSHTIPLHEVRSLRQYLLARQHPLGSLPSDLEAFLDNVSVCPHPVQPKLKAQPQSGPTRRLDQVLEQHYLRLLLSRQTEFVQTLGLALCESECNFKMTSFSLARGQLQSPQFEWLLRVAGEATLLDLLQGHYIFINKRNIHLQICGPSLSCKFAGKTPAAKKLSDNPKQSEISALRVNRFQMFYCNHVSRIPGLFKAHPLLTRRKLDLFFFLFVAGRPVEKVPPSKENGGGELLERAERQVRALVSGQERDRLQGFFNQLLLRLQQSVARSSKFKLNRFTAILVKHCRLPADYKQLQHRTVGVLLGVEEPVQQLFDLLYEKQVPYERVAQFLLEFLKTIVPRGLLDEGSWEELPKVLQLFVSRKRFQFLKAEDLVQGFDLFRLGWASFSYSQRFARAIKARYRRVVAHVLLFVFNEIVIPVMRHNFYVTERHKQSNRLFYYRKEVWNLISKLAIKKFGAENLALLNAQEVGEVSRRDLVPVGKLRIMPKSGSFRPIITFNRKVKGGCFNLNQLLLDTRLVLRNLKAQLAESGICVFDNEQVFLKMGRFTKQWREKGEPKLWFFSLDIKKCYDSIDSRRLAAFIESSRALQDYFLINKYLHLYRNKKALRPDLLREMPQYFNLRERFVALSISGDSGLSEPFREKASGRASIVVPTGKVRSIASGEIVRKLTSVCCGTSIVEYGGKKYKQVHGIPQGLNVSGVLCSLYFHCVEEEFGIGRFPEGELALLMRLTDDYFFIGESPTTARHVLSLLQASAAKYNFAFSAQKMTSNLEQDCASVVWIGKSIELASMEVLPAYDQDLSKLAYSMNVNLSRAGELLPLLRNKLKSLLTNHLASGFDSALFPMPSLLRSVELLVFLSLHKFMPFVDEVARLRIKSPHILMAKVFSLTFHQFVLYLCFLWKDQSQVGPPLYSLLLLTILSQAASVFARVRGPLKKRLARYFISRRDKITLEAQRELQN